MLKTKLLSILVAFALMVTVGGVYAAWNYYQGTLYETTKYFDDVTSILDAKSIGAPGSFAIDKTGLSIAIDDTNDDYFAELVITGSLKLIFEPATSEVSDEIISALGMQFTLGNHAGMVYPAGSSTSIFNIDTTTVVAGQDIVIDESRTIDVGDFEKNALTGNWEWTVPAEVLQHLITLGDDFELDTMAEHAAFKTQLHNGAISILIEQAGGSPTPPAEPSVE